MMSNNFPNIIWRYYLLGLVPPLLSASSYILSKYAFSNVSPISLMFYRWLFATMVLTPFMIGKFYQELPQIKRNLGIITLMGISGISFFSFFAYCALERTTTTNTAIISSLTPVFVLILIRTMHQEKLSKLHWLALFLALMGAMIIISRGHIGKGINELFHNTGDFFALAAAFSFAIYFVAMPHKPRDISFYPFTYSLFLVGTIAMVPMYLYDLLCTGNTMEFNLHNFYIIAYLGLVVSAMGVISMNKAVIKLGPDIASLLFYFAPVFTSILAVVTLGETFEGFHMVGMCLILIGVNLPVVRNIYIIKRR